MNKNFFILSIFLNIIAFPIKEQFEITIILCSLSYLFLFINEYKNGSMSCVGGFIFGSLIFFGIRPIYILIENDFRLLENVFLIFDNREIVSVALWWSNFGLIFFKFGSQFKFRSLANKFACNLNLRISNNFNSTKQIKFLIIFLITLTFPIISFYTQFSRYLVYASSLGAYFYLFPSLLQALNVFSTLIFIREYTLKRNLNNLIFAILLLLYTGFFAIQMRQISSFRGFFLTGLMILAIAIIHLYRDQKVNYLWLIIAFIFFQPLFRTLGAERAVLNQDFNLLTFFNNQIISSSVLRNYWDFYSSNGDINIFDTFVGAFNSAPKWYPFFESWLYVPVHIVPRFIWEGKPLSPFVQDLSFLGDVPLSPGIVGFFLLDGGKIWMLGCMTLLGSILSFFDDFINSLSSNLFKSFVYASFIISSVTLTRFALFQTFYELLFSLLPITLVSVVVFPNKSKKLSHSSKI